MADVLAERQFGEDRAVQLVWGDLTEEAVDAIVNAANSRLAHGGGVAAAIVRKGGSIIQEESDRIGYVPVGEAAITTGGKLKARYVIHAVGPQWGEGDEDEKLKNAVENSLRLAVEHQLTRISLPAISSGIFGFPKERCARIIWSTVCRFLEQSEAGTVKAVRVCVYDQPTRAAFEQTVDEQNAGGCK